MKKEAELVRNLGFTGKGSIHPKQINILNEVFTPSKDEITKAKKVIDQFWDLDLIKKPSDIFKLDYQKIKDLEGWGSLSIDNLRKAIDKGGSSIRDFMNTSGDQGSFQKNFNVYQRENKKCLKYSCKGTIHKKFISNRSSFFCNLCQK